MEEIKGKVGQFCSWLNISTLCKMNCSVHVALYAKILHDLYVFLNYFFIKDSK